MTASVAFEQYWTALASGHTSEAVRIAVGELEQGVPLATLAEGMRIVAVVVDEKCGPLPRAQSMLAAGIASA
jgi:hypothetical protein